MLSSLKIRSRLLLVALVPVTAMVLSVTVSRWQPAAGLGLAALGSVASVILATSVATSIVTPLSQLGAAAERGAHLHALVEALRRPGARDGSVALTPVGLESDDELGQAAQSFDAFQGSAAKLAVQQAALLNRSVADKGTFEVFVNLARRMQGLVDHQIEFLDGLEASEQDPDTLDNLFKLDQLATRVRRNAESLLAMAGTTSGRSWERPLSMSDVIRAGIAEIEDLGRIDLVVHDDATMVGNVAADAAHLLSELLENATRWSPPDTRVEVTGEPKLGGYRIEVRDSGIGMDAEALAEANHILTGPALAGATVARSLGLVVAGRLAKRLGITVHLAAGSPGGIVATVLVPPSLMVSGEAAEAVEAAGARTLPFALARQEKRARISSQ
ncbi:MAG: sensor histidine kinase, partial [Acidimicrobiales bacterium]